jgi:hypothetical protein
MTMTDKHTQFDGSIPEKYDEHLGPLLFEHYARDLARRVTVRACGTGISTAFPREALPDSVEINPIKPLLSASGFGAIDVNVIPIVVKRPSVRHVAIGFVEGTPSIHEVHERAAASPDQVVDAVTEVLTGAFGDAPLRAPLRLP